MTGGISGGIGKYAGPFLPKGFTGLAGRTLTGGVSGGITSSLYGRSFGKGFKLGAGTSAFAFLFNEAAHEDMFGHKPEQKDYATVSLKRNMVFHEKTFDTHTQETSTDITSNPFPGASVELNFGSPGEASFSFALGNYFGGGVSWGPTGFTGGSLSFGLGLNIIPYYKYVPVLSATLPK